MTTEPMVTWSYNDLQGVQRAINLAVGAFDRHGVVDEASVANLRMASRLLGIALDSRATPPADEGGTDG